MFDVNNNVSKALLYPSNMSTEDLEKYSQDQNYTSSQIKGMLNDIEDLTKKYTELKYESIISGHATKGYIQNANINFSSLPQLEEISSGTVDYYVTGNTIGADLDIMQSGIAIYNFPGGSKMKSILCLAGSQGGTVNTNIKIFYSTDNGETWTRCNQVRGIGYRNYSDTYSDISELIFDSQGLEDTGTDYAFEFLIDENLTKVINKIKIEATNLMTSSSSRFTRDISLSFIPSMGTTNTILDDDLGIVSKTGMWNGGTGSMSIADSGVLELTNALPENTYLSLCIKVDNSYTTTSEEFNNCKKMFIQWSNDGITWLDNRKNSYSDINPTNYVIGAASQYMYGFHWKHTRLYTLPAGYKYYRFYTPQDQTSTAKPCTSINLLGICYTKTYIAPTVESIKAESTQKIISSFCVLESDNKLTYTSKIIIDPDDLAEETTLMVQQLLM